MREIFEKIESYQHNFTLELVREKIDLILCPSFVSFIGRLEKQNFNRQHTHPIMECPTKWWLPVLTRLSTICSTILQELWKWQVWQRKTRWSWNNFLKTMIGTSKSNKNARSVILILSCFCKFKCQGCVGFPISVQIAAPPYREELCLRILRDIEQAFNWS